MPIVKRYKLTHGKMSNDVIPDTSADTRADNNTEVAKIPYHFIIFRTIMLS